MEYLYKRRYLKEFEDLSAVEQQRVVDAVQEIQQYHRTGQAPHGLRIKQLYASAQGRIFEARVSLAARIVWTHAGERVTFMLLGTHDEVRRFLRHQ